MKDIHKKGASIRYQLGRNFEDSCSYRFFLMCEGSKKT